MLAREASGQTAIRHTPDAFPAAIGIAFNSLCTIDLRRTMEAVTRAVGGLGARAVAHASGEWIGLRQAWLFSLVASRKL